MACQRCNRAEPVARYRVTKGGIVAERDFCTACAELTAAIYDLEPMQDDGDDEGPDGIFAPPDPDPAESPEEETAEPIQEEPNESLAVPEAAEEEPKPAPTSRGRRRRKS